MSYYAVYAIGFVTGIINLARWNKFQQCCANLDAYDVDVSKEIKALKWAVADSEGEGFPVINAKRANVGYGVASP